MGERLGHIILSAIMLLSTVGVFVSKHYCRGELKSTALYSRAKSCHSSDVGKVCPMHKAQGENTSTDCCDDQSEFIKADNDQISVDKVLQDVMFMGIAATPVILDSGLPPGFDRKTAKFYNHSPPLIIRDLIALHQVFLN